MLLMLNPERKQIIRLPFSFLIRTTKSNTFGALNITIRKTKQNKTYNYRYTLERMTQWRMLQIEYYAPHEVDNYFLEGVTFSP
jgi:hypothetical protein